MDQQNMSLAGGDVIILLVLLFYLLLRMVRSNEITGQSFSVVLTLSLFKNGLNGHGVTIEDRPEI